MGLGRLAVFRGASTQKDMETTLLRAPEKSCTRRPHLQPRCCLCTPDPLTHCPPDFFWGALQGTSSPLCPHLCYSPNLALSWHSLTSISQFKPDSSPPGTSLPPEPRPNPSPGPGEIPAQMASPHVAPASSAVISPWDSWCSLPAQPAAYPLPALQLQGPV